MTISRHRASRAALAILGLTLASCASSHPPADVPVVEIDRMEEVLGHEQAPFIIRIPAGTRLPVMVVVATPFAHSESGGAALEVVFDRTVYWYPRTPDRISFDGLQWQPFTEGHEGQLSFGLGKSDEHGPHANVRIALAPSGSE